MNRPIRADRSAATARAALSVAVVAALLVSGLAMLLGGNVAGSLWGDVGQPGTDLPIAAPTVAEPALGGAPTSPPVAICGNGSALTGPSSPPPGAVSIPAGNDSDMTASYELQPNTTYWLAPGVHTLGTGPYSQFQPDPGDTFLGAPGAIVDGQGLNQFAFTFDPSGSTSNVTIEYLTVRNFTSGQGEGVVNQNGEPGWTVEHNTVGPNEYNGSNPGGAGVLLGWNNVSTGVYKIASA